MRKLTEPVINDVVDLKDFNKKHWDEIVIISKMLRKRGRSLLKQISQANEARAKQVGNKVTFVVNYNINFTNHCIGTCRFCAFKYRKNDRNSISIRMTLEDIKSEVRKALGYSATEVCVQGGLDPTFDYEHYIEILKAIRSVSSSIHIHAFSPAEVAYMSQLSGENVEDIFKELKKNGLGSFPGTAAEILVDRVRQVICPDKINTKQWVNIVAIGHMVGLHSTATMMYGHIETYEDEATHLAILRYIQEQTNMFTEFVPLPFIHYNTQLFNMGARPGSTGFHDLALFSAARLFFGDIIPNLQASWPKLGLKFAQTSLIAGVNDLGGTLYHENISRSAGASYGEFVEVDEFIDVVKESHRVPTQRDTLYTKFTVLD